MKNPKPLSAKLRCLIDPPPTSFPRRRASRCGGKPQSPRTGHRTVGATLVVAPAAPRRGLPWPCTRPSLIHRHCEPVTWRSNLAAVVILSAAKDLLCLPTGSLIRHPHLTPSVTPTPLRHCGEPKQSGGGVGLALMPACPGPPLTGTLAPARSKPSL